MQPQQPEVTLRDYLKVVFRQKSVILTCLFTVMVTVLIGLQLKTPVYEATVKMQVSGEKPTESPYYRDLLGYQRMEVALTQAEIVISNPVLERTINALGLYKKPLDYERAFSSPLRGKFIGLRTRTMLENLAKMKPEQQKAFLFRNAVEQLREAIKVEPIRDTNLFTVSARDFSNVGATIIANTVSRSYQIFDLEQQLVELQLKYGEKHQIVQQLKDNIEKMGSNLTGELLPDMEAIGPASVKIIEQASVPLEPVGPPKAMVVLLAFCMSIFLGVMLAFMFEYMDQTFRTPFDVEKTLAVPFLGYVLKRKMMDKALLTGSKKLGDYGRTVQVFAEQVYLLMKDKQLQSVVFASCLPKEGSSVLVANLGILLSSKLHHRVLIIDANLRSPVQHKLFKITEFTGLTSVIEKDVPVKKAIVGLDTNLALLPAGQTELNPITLLDSGTMANMLEELRESYDIILIDAAPLKDYKDSYVVAGKAGGMVVVIGEGKTRRQVVRSAIGPLMESSDKLLGVVLNDRTYPIPKVIYNMV